MTRKPCDRLESSRFWVLVLTSATIAMVVTLSVFSFTTRGEHHRFTRILIKTLSLDTPALFPTGRVSRNHGYTHPAVDLRHSPMLPLHGFSPEVLLFGRPEPEYRYIPQHIQ